MNKKISEAEYNVMELIWANGGSMQARAIGSSLHNNLSLSLPTVYTMIDRLIAKGILTRKDPGFFLIANVPIEQVRIEETDKMIDRFYNGSMYDLLVDCIKRNRLSENDKLRLKRIVKDM